MSDLSDLSAWLDLTQQAVVQLDPRVRILVSVFRREHKRKHYFSWL
jgi:hypothetical protein